MIKNIAEQVIEKCGGARKVQEMLASEGENLRINAVYKFTYEKNRGGTGGLIPARYQEPLLVAARKAGIDLVPADFFQEETLETIADVPSTAPTK